MIILIFGSRGLASVLAHVLLTVSSDLHYLRSTRILFINCVGLSDRLEKRYPAIDINLLLHNASRNGWEPFGRSRKLVTFVYYSVHKRLAVVSNLYLCAFLDYKVVATTNVDLRIFEYFVSPILRVCAIKSRMYPVEANDQIRDQYP